MNKPIVGITMGDPAGSGPEITIKALADPEQYIHNNKEMLEQYRAVVESEEYKTTPAYRLQEYLKQFQMESGYNDVFIPAMQRLSPAYREYYKALQAANEVFVQHFRQE